MLGLADDERPVAVVVEGTWWREDHTRRRLAQLESVRELGIPDVFLGSCASRSLIYACPYGAPRTAEVVQVAALIGVRLAIQIGSCGVVGAGVRPGDVVVPTVALGLDGTTVLYSTDARVAASEEWGARAAASLGRRGVAAYRGPTVTWPTLFNQPLAGVREWARQGYLGVDMETATTLAVARTFGTAAMSMLVAWDEVLSERSFLDRLPADQQAAFEHAEDEIFQVALQLISEV